MRQLLYKSYVHVYRIAAVVALYGMLAGIAAYGALMGFYAVSTSWIAPITISPSNDKILAMTAQIVSSQQALDNLRLQNRSMAMSRGEMVNRRIVLRALSAQLDTALDDERRSNAVSGNLLAHLADQKKADLQRSKLMLGDIDSAKSEVERNLKVGLITKSEAIAQETLLAQFANSYTDGQVGAVLLQDNVRQKMTTDLTAVDTLSKRVDLQSQIAQLNLQIASGDAQMQANSAQIEKVRQGIQATQDNPYYLATTARHALDFAFVSYDNMKGAEAGAPLYDCILSFVACKQVGAVERVFTEEEHSAHPIFKGDMRGILIQLTLSNSESVKSKTLFLNRKPLLF